MVFPALAAVFRFKIMIPKYRPLLILLLLGLINESLSAIYIFSVKSNTINSNIYVLVEYLLILWQFNRLGTSYSKTFFTVLVTLGAATWFVDNLLLSSLQNNNSLFRMCSSLVLVYVSIEKANQLLFFNGIVLIRNPDLLISLGFFAYFSFKTFIEVFNVFPMRINPDFYANLWVILSVINIFTNLLFTLAIICIRRKEEFILHS